jgi:hypothetical protein
MDSLSVALAGTGVYPSPLVVQTKMLVALFRAAGIKLLLRPARTRNAVLMLLNGDGNNMSWMLGGNQDQPSTGLDMPK